MSINSKFFYVFRNSLTHSLEIWKMFFQRSVDKYQARMLAPWAISPLWLTKWIKNVIFHPELIQKNYKQTHIKFLNNEVFCMHFCWEFDKFLKNIAVCPWGITNSKHNWLRLIGSILCTHSSSFLVPFSLLRFMFFDLSSINEINSSYDIEPSPLRSNSLKMFST